MTNWHEDSGLIVKELAGPDGELRWHVREFYGDSYAADADRIMVGAWRRADGVDSTMVWRNVNVAVCRQAAMTGNWSDVVKSFDEAMACVRDEFWKTSPKTKRLAWHRRRKG